jgi:hypothetical protein
MVYRGYIYTHTHTHTHTHIYILKKTLDAEYLNYDLLYSGMRK